MYQDTDVQGGLRQVTRVDGFNTLLYVPPLDEYNIYVDGTRVYSCQRWDKLSVLMDVIGRVTLVSGGILQKPRLENRQGDAIAY
jgi:hypothetical protein